jgi:hypothetical protein
MCKTVISNQNTHQKVGPTTPKSQERGQGSIISLVVTIHATSWSYEAWERFKIGGKRLKLIRWSLADYWLEVKTTKNKYENDLPLVDQRHGAEVLRIYTRSEQELIQK